VGRFGLALARGGCYFLAMPQVQLPVFPAGSTPLNESLAFVCRDGQVTYFNGHLPVFTHAQSDLAAFRLFTSQLVVNGSASQGDIRRAFGVPKVAVQRAVDRFRADGAAAFFVPPTPRVGTKLTPTVLPQVQTLLDQGQSVPQISRATGVLANTIHKAIRLGRLRVAAKKKTLPPAR
jgi:transposase-like protein